METLCSSVITARTSMTANYIRSACTTFRRHVEAILNMEATSSRRHQHGTSLYLLRKFGYAVPWHLGNSTRNMLNVCFVVDQSAYPVFLLVSTDNLEISS